jgi:hypothetical protein
MAPVTEQPPLWAPTVGTSEPIKMEMAFQSDGTDEMGQMLSSSNSLIGKSIMLRYYHIEHTGYT